MGESTPSPHPAGTLPKASRGTSILMDLPLGRIEAALELPTGPVRLVGFAFNLLGLSSAAADMAQRQIEKLGRKVSCRKGCGACCRQIVPLSPLEATMVSEMVGSLAGPERGHVTARFADIEARLKETGLWDKLWRRIGDPFPTEAETRAIGREYFELGLPCPFLEDESCSIHEVRPSACREYLVTTPSENCADPFNRPIEKVNVSLRLSETFARLFAALLKETPRIVPLTLSLAWARQNPNVSSLGAQGGALLEFAEAAFKESGGSVKFHCAGE